MTNINTTYLDKLDAAAADGLLGTLNSMSYRIAEIERHLHSGGRWVGLATTTIAETHIAVSPSDADTAGAFQLDGGDSSATPTFGSWVQIMGSDDTPFRSGFAYFDPHLMLITDAEEDVPYLIQISRGATGDAGVAAETYSEVMVGVDATKKFKVAIPIQTGRAPAGSKLWARCICFGKNTGTIDFYLGLHEYEG